MTEQITEIVYIPLKPDLDLDAGDARRVWDASLATIAKQPGLRKLFWGRQIEDKNTLQLVQEWDSLASHRAFEASADFPDFLLQMQTHLFAAYPPILHARLLPRDDWTPLRQPVTECVSAYFAADYPQEAYSADFATFRSEALRIPDAGVRGIVGGWSPEGATHEGLGEGVEGKRFVAFLGWESVEAHRAFRETEAGVGVIGHLRAGTKGVRVWHVGFKEYK
ncbi:hypothetical protein ACN47E_007131 [Coniothyrium glycines]